MLWDLNFVRNLCLDDFYGFVNSNHGTHRQNAGLGKTPHPNTCKVCNFNFNGALFLCKLNIEFCVLLSKIMGLVVVTCSRKCAQTNRVCLDIAYFTKN